MKRTLLSTLSLTLTAALFLAGCAPSKQPVVEATRDPGVAGVPTETTPPAEATPPVETALPTEGFAPVEDTGLEEPGTAGEVTQLRLAYRQGDWWRDFENGDSYFFVAESVDDLTQGLRSRGVSVDSLDLTFYDEDFFTSNRLVVIPRTANTGSVRYGCVRTPQKDGLLLTVTAEAPEYATTDMADFLVLVSVALADYPDDMDIRVDPAGNPTAVGGKNHLATE